MLIINYYYEKEKRTGESGKVSRFGERTEENLEYICNSCFHCGWSIRTVVCNLEKSIKLNIDKKEIPKVKFAASLRLARIILRKVLDLPGRLF